jgi:hypothetical protein
LPLLAAVATAGLLGCGGDEEKEGGIPTTPPAQTAREPVTTPPPETTPAKREPEKDPAAEMRTVAPGEDQGDEEPIRSEAVFTGRGGKLAPAVVRVPAYIAIRVILRSADARRYTLSIEGERLSIEGDGTDEAELPGLLPNRSYAGRGPQGSVRIEATAEPGP